VFHVDGVVDAGCEDVAPDAYEEVGGDSDGHLDTWGRYADVCIDFGTRPYVLEVDAGATMTFGLHRGDGCSAR
jgi:hypothetical protein